MMNVRTTAPLGAPAIRAGPKSVWSARLGVLSPSAMVAPLPVTLISAGPSTVTEKVRVTAFTPPFEVPPLSVTVTLITAVPLALATGV